MASIWVDIIWADVTWSSYHLDWISPRIDIILSFPLCVKGVIGESIFVLHKSACLCLCSHACCGVYVLLCGLSFSTCKIISFSLFSTFSNFSDFNTWSTVHIMHCFCLWQNLVLFHALSSVFQQFYKLSIGRFVKFYWSLENSLLEDLPQMYLDIWIHKNLLFSSVLFWPFHLEKV